ncbi:MAG: PEP-CTERM sorting domain-containing protein [Cyanobacteria bacterium Co-bin13]|nr:PEP-CTERM sorting domain-containing protein [Cyanobacteria bacterium Co-bin13]
MRTLLPATLAACGLAVGTSLFAQAQAATFSLTPFTGNNARVSVTLDALTNGNIDVKVDVDKTLALADLRGIFFNVKNEAILPHLNLLNASAGVGTFKFAANSVSEVGKVKLQGEPTLNPCGSTGCDGGIEIGQDGLKGGKDDYQSASWTFTRKDGQALTLADFEGMSWGIRATSVGTGNSREGSTKLSGVVPKPPAAEPPRDIPEPTTALGILVVAAGAAASRRSVERG